MLAHIQPPPQPDLLGGGKKTELGLQSVHVAFHRGYGMRSQAIAVASHHIWDDLDSLGNYYSLEGPTLEPSCITLWRAIHVSRPVVSHSISFTISLRSDIEAA